MAGETTLAQAEEALDRLPQRRPASLYDVAVQYSVLDWYETVTAGDLDFDLDPEYLAFMTPRAKSDHYGESDNVLVAYVDLSEPDDPQFRDDRPIALETAGPGLRYRLGHSYPANKTSSMTDYSITTHKEASEHHLLGQRKDAWGTNNVQDRFTDWAYSDAADRVLDRSNDDEGWILEALRELGTDEDRLDELVRRDGVPLDPDDEETEHEVFVTVRIRLPEEDRYRWPGEIDVLNEVMVEQKAERFENISVDDAGGRGVGYVSDREGRVTGGSAGLLGMYAKKQREHFEDLSVDGSAAWRNRPLTRDTAAAIATANSVFESFYQGLGNSRRLYVLPYLGASPEAIDPGDFDAFATDVFSELRNREDASFEAKVDEVFYERKTGNDSSADALFGGDRPGPDYGQVKVATVFQVTGNPDRIFFEETDTDVHRPLAVDEAHHDVLGSAFFRGDGIFREARERSGSPLLSRTAGHEALALFGGYFEWTTEPTRSSEDAQETPKAGDIDDVRSRRLQQFLSGMTIPVSTLLEEYLHLLIQRQRDQFGETDGLPVPGRQVLEQYVQLRALDGIDALGSRQPRDTEPTTLADSVRTATFATVTDTSSTDYENRTDRLEGFLAEHDVLRNDPARRAVFLLGGLVGRISSYQRKNDISSTLVRRYPIDYLTKQSIKEVTNEVLQMNTTYVESDEELPPTYNARYTNPLPDLMLDGDPRDWSFPQNELQWLYALGITYGMNDTAIDEEENT